MTTKRKKNHKAKQKRSCRPLRQAEIDLYELWLEGGAKGSLNAVAKKFGINRKTAAEWRDKAAAVLAPKFLEHARSELAALAPKAVLGLKRHLSQKLPEPSVLNKYFEGTRVYKHEVEVTGNLTVEEIAKKRKASLSKGLAALGVKVKPE